jgi:hypothetical protein
VWGHDHEIQTIYANITFFLRASFVRLHVLKLEPVPLLFTEWNLFFYTAEMVACFAR